MGKYDVSNTERQIMEYLWDRNTTVQTGELLSEFNSRGKNWKAQTLNTLLIRLAEMGLIQRQRGKVTPAYSRQEYNRRVATDILERSYQGKLKNFIAALTGGSHIDDALYAELKEMIEGK